ncbi:hypothetical protein [Candidatus Sodalis pierantonius]|uniref:hypothetical protein n=1 Tax=Candidatus Sodalis pierantonii TaxID=1486991 RepID=UPI00130E0D7D|nr:hypothetical protein [Candidatus Sodalis pierantonius]
MPIKITVTLLDDEKGTHANVRAKQKKVTPHEDKCARLLLKLIEMSGRDLTIFVWLFWAKNRLC